MKANFSFLQSALNLRSWFTLSLQSAASRLNVVLLRELAVVLHLVKLLICFFISCKMFLSNCKAMPTSSQFSIRSWSRHGRCCSTQPPSLPQDPTWQQRLAIPVQQMNEAMFGGNKSYLETLQNCHQQNPIASRESQLWRGAFPKESWQEQTDPAGGKQLQAFSRKLSRL